MVLKYCSTGHHHENAFDDTVVGMEKFASRAAIKKNHFFVFFLSTFKKMSILLSAFHPR